MMANGESTKQKFNDPLKARGIRVMTKESPVYDIIGSSFRPGYLKKEPVDKSIDHVRALGQSFMQGGKFEQYLKPTDIMRGVSGLNFYGTHPQYALEQFVGENALQDGMAVFGFDIEALGGFQKNTTSKIFSPTEIAIRTYGFNGNPGSGVQVGSTKGVKDYFQKKGKDLNIVRQLDKHEEEYFNNLLEKLKKVSSVNMAPNISKDDMRSLHDLMKYAGDAKFDKNGVIQHNTKLPSKGMLTAADVDIIRQGMANLKKYGLGTEEFLQATNDYVNKNIKGKKAFKTMSYNGNNYDIPGLKYFFGDRIDLFSSQKGYSGNIDWYDTLHSLFSNPMRKLYGDRYLPGTYNTTQESIGARLFGMNVAGAHNAIFDIGIQENIANWLMGDIDKVYVNNFYKNKVPVDQQGRALPYFPSKGKIGTAYYRPEKIEIGDKLWAHRGLGKTQASSLDMVFQLNRQTNEYKYLDYHSNSVLSGKTYEMKGMFQLGDPKKENLFGMMLYNEDDDLFHMIIREDPRELQNLVHERFSYLGGNKSPVLPTELLGRHEDAARRAYNGLFNPTMDHAAGYTTRQAKKYLDANDLINNLIKDKELNIYKDKDGLYTEGIQDLVAAKTGMTRAQARNYLYMKDRLDSESTMFRPMVDRLNTLLETGKISGGEADAAMYNFKQEVEGALGSHRTRIKPKFAAEQMFILDPVDRKYKLANIGSISDLTASINQVVKQGRDSNKYKNNADAIIKDLRGRGYLNDNQAQRLRRMVRQMDATQVDAARTTLFMRDIADEVLKSPNKNIAARNDFLKKVGKEFDIANAIEKSEQVATNTVQQAYLQNRIKGGIEANYLQESLAARQITLDAVDKLTSNSLIEQTISKSSRAFKGNRLGEKGKLAWTHDALGFLSNYDRATKKALRNISNLEESIDFAQGYKGIALRIDELVEAYLGKDKKGNYAATVGLDKNKETIIINIHDKKMTTEIMKSGEISDKYKGVVQMRIGLPDADNIVKEGNRSLFNQIFLQTKYGIQAPTVQDIYGETLVDRKIRHLKMGARAVMEELQSGARDAAKVANRIAKRYGDRAIESASGSGKFVGALEENPIDASNSSLAAQRGSIVHTSELTNLYEATRGKSFDELYESQTQAYLRNLSRDFQKYNLPLTFSGVKGSGALSGSVSSRSARSSVPLGAYGAATRENYNQYASYYDLSKYDIYNEANRWRIDEGTLTTKTGLEDMKGDLPGLKVNVAYMTDDTIMRQAEKAGLKNAGELTSQEGMVLVSEKLRGTLKTEEKKFIEIPEGMELSDEMKKILDRISAADGKVEVELPAWEPGKTFTIAKALTDEITGKPNVEDIVYRSRHKAKVIGLLEKDGKYVLEVNQLLDAENGMKVFLGTDKFTVRYTSEENLEAIGGKGIDAIASGKWAGRQDWNNPITADLNLTIDEARKSGKSYNEIEKAFKETIGIDLEFQKQKVTIGKNTRQEIERFIPVIPDLVNPNEKAPDLLGPDKLLALKKALDVDAGPSGDIFYGVQEMRVSMVSRYPITFGSNVGLDQGVRYGLRELEMIRNRKLVIGGREYQGAGSVYKWYEDAIDERASKKFEGSYQRFISGIDKGLRSVTDDAVIEDGDLFYESRMETKGTGTAEKHDFQSLKALGDIQELTRSELEGTILNPTGNTKSNGFWLETPFDFTIEGEGVSRNKLFIVQDEVRGPDGSLYPTEIQRTEMGIERAAREFIAIRDDKNWDPNKSQQEALNKVIERGNRKVNEYIQQLGKDAMGSHGRVTYDIMTAKLGNSGHFTAAGMNVFSDGSAWTNTGKKVASNTSFISEDAARGLFEGLDLSNDQINDIIGVMKGEGEYSRFEGIFATTNRYPTFDTGAINFGRTMISDKVQGDTAVISVGDAMLLKADFDGDHLSKIAAFANKLKGTNLKYSDLLTAAESNYEKITAGDMSLDDIDNGLIKEFTEFRMHVQVDAEKSETIGNYVKAKYLKDSKFGSGKIVSLDRIEEEIRRRGEDASAFKGFGKRLTTHEQIISEEFLAREARIMKQVGSASNLNARVRRLAETLTGTEDVMMTVGVAMQDAATGTSVFNSILPQDVWDKISTGYSIYEQSGISSKHILPLLERMGVKPENITPEIEEQVYEKLGWFKQGLETFDADLLRKTQAEFEAMGMKDILRLGSGEISADEVSTAFKNGLMREGTEDQLNDFVSSFKFLNMGEENSVEALIQAVDEVGEFLNQYDFQTNPFLKFSLSEPGSATAAVNRWKELSDPNSKYFVPTKEVEKLYYNWGRSKEFNEAAERYAQKVSFQKSELKNRYIGGDGRFSSVLGEDASPIHTLGGDTVESIKTKIFDGVDGGGMAKGAIAGAAVFGAMWAASALLRSGPDEKDREIPQADQAPSSDGRYVNPAVFGPAPRGAAPTARISPRGGGYENISININADDAHGWSESEIRDIVREQLSGQMPVDVNMNMTSKDNTQRIDRQWVNDTVTRAIRYGYAF